MWGLVKLFSFEAARWHQRGGGALYFVCCVPSFPFDHYPFGETHFVQCLFMADGVFFASSPFLDTTNTSDSIGKPILYWFGVKSLFLRKRWKKALPPLPRAQISHGTQAWMVGELTRSDEWISLCFDPSSLCHCFPSFISSPFLSSSQSRLQREIFSIHLSKKISSVVSFPSSCAGDVFLKGEVPRKKLIYFFFHTLTRLFWILCKTQRRSSTVL